MIGKDEQLDAGYRLYGQACPVPGAPLAIEPHCLQCAFDEHRCQGCGEPTAHGVSACPTCKDKYRRPDDARRQDPDKTASFSDWSAVTARDDGRVRVPSLGDGTADRLDARAAELERTAVELRTLANVLRLRALVNPDNRAPQYRIQFRSIQFPSAETLWVESIDYPWTYGRYEAEEICTDNPGRYRMVPCPTQEAPPEIHHDRHGRRVLVNREDHRANPSH